MEFLHHIQDFFAHMGSFGLGLLAFIESSFFPLPPDVLLIAMTLSKPQNAMVFALICTIFSTLGGGFGYAIGKFGGRPAFHWIFKKQAHQLEKVEHIYNKYGVWAVITAAFTPVPYKVFTIASGIFALNFPAFMLASFIGRGARFFIVAGALMLFGETIKAYVELVIIGLTILVAVFFGLLYWKRKKFINPEQAKQEGL
jgi:membrane protein YqaA with SNARE-associated domain